MCRLDSFCADPTGAQRHRRLQQLCLGNCQCGVGKKNGHYTAHATMPMQLPGCPCAVDIFLALRMQVHPAISCLQLKACKLIKIVGLIAFASEFICCCQPGGLCFLMMDRTYSMAPPRPSTTTSAQTAPPPAHGCLPQAQQAN